MGSATAAVELWVRDDGLWMVDYMCFHGSREWKRDKIWGCFFTPKSKKIGFEKTIWEKAVMETPRLWKTCFGKPFLENSFEKTVFRKPFLESRFCKTVF